MGPWPHCTGKVVDERVRAVDAELLHARASRGSPRCWNAPTTRRSQNSPTPLEKVTMHEKYYTPEQLSQLEARRQEVGDEQIQAIERESRALGRDEGQGTAKWIRLGSCPALRSGP